LPVSSDTGGGEKGTVGGVDFRAGRSTRE